MKKPWSPGDDAERRQGRTGRSWPKARGAIGRGGQPGQRIERSSTPGGTAQSGQRSSVLGTEDGDYVPSCLNKTRGIVPPSLSGTSGHGGGEACLLEGHGHVALALRCPLQRLALGEIAEDYRIDVELLLAYAGL